MGAPALLLPALLATGGEALPVRLNFDRCLLKANPTVENGQRVVYMQASSEVRDLQGERVLLSALEASIPYFLRYGRLDLDHASVLGEIRGQKVNPYAYEIGKPVDARLQDGAIWVKAAIFSSSDKTGQNRWTEAADLFWDSLHTNPPVSWYPSVAGDVYSEDPVQDPDGNQTNEVRGIRWHSIGLSRTPVNQGLAPASTMPFRAFAKAFATPSEFRAALESLGPRYPDPLIKIAPGDPDVVTILRLLDQAQPDLGFDELIAEAGARGIPPEHVIATMLALLKP